VQKRQKQTREKPYFSTEFSLFLLPFLLKQLYERLESGDIRATFFFKIFLT
jgi:hypothetical protein